MGTITFRVDELVKFSVSRSKIKPHYSRNLEYFLSAAQYIFNY